MPQLRTQLINDPYYLGQVFVEIEKAWDEADYSEELKSFMPELEEFHLGLFASESSPAGEPWAPNAPATVKRKGHDVVLVETGREAVSLTSTTGDSVREVFERGLTFGTSVPYSIFHNFSDGRHEPKREDVGWNENLIDKAANRVADAIVEKLTG